MLDIFGSFEKDFNEKRESYDEYKQSQQYQSAISYTNNLIHDFNQTLLLCQFVSTRDGEYFKKSILFWSLLEIIDSLESIRESVINGHINPAKRELRYLLETMIKYLYTDQQCQSDWLSLDERIAYFKKEVPRSSISPVDDLEGVHDDFVEDVKQVYGVLSSYTHPSFVQIKEYLIRETQDRSFAFETHIEINSFNKILFRSLDLFLYLAFKEMVPASLGDLFIYFIDDMPKWKFKQGKYSMLMSKLFDYKLERKQKRAQQES
ncbi:hypothetical protein ACQXR1_10565 [Bacillus sp. ATD]|uniref:hypothetical protein n=1 Tax=Bacillus sp. ATD TaxID=3422305 RepID=UPI003D352302